MNDEFKVEVNSVEFDNDLYEQNLKDNDFSSWKTAEGVGSDDVKGEDK